MKEEGEYVAECLHDVLGETVPDVGPNMCHLPTVCLRAYGSSVDQCMMVFIGCTALPPPPPPPPHTHTHTHTFFFFFFRKHCNNGQTMKAAKSRRRKCLISLTASTTSPRRDCSGFGQLFIEGKSLDRNKIEGISGQR